MSPALLNPATQPNEIAKPQLTSSLQGETLNSEHIASYFEYPSHKLEIKTKGLPAGIYAAEAVSSKTDVQWVAETIPGGCIQAGTLTGIAIQAGTVEGTIFVARTIIGESIALETIETANLKNECVQGAKVQHSVTNAALPTEGAEAAKMSTGGATVGTVRTGRIFGNSVVTAFKATHALKIKAVSVFVMTDKENLPWESYSGAYHWIATSTEEVEVIFSSAPGKEKLWLIVRA